MAIVDLILSSITKGAVAFLGFGTILVAGSCIVVSIYRLWFSPLSKFPGPKFAAISRLPRQWALMTGWERQWVAEQHARYGEIVRLEPNSLSFTTHDAWKELYGHRQGKLNLPKEFILPSANGVPSIIHAEDTDHSRMRRLLSHAFSEKALREQEPLLQSYVDSFIEGVRKQQGPVNLVTWFNWLTFDVVGHLSMGRPFDCLKEAKSNEWVAAVTRGIKIGVMLAATKNLVGSYAVVNFFTPSSLLKKRRTNMMHTQRMASERIARGPGDTPDFMSYILRYNDEKGMSRGEIDATGAVLFAAGSETTASLLAGFAYYLLKYPDVLKKATDEVRQTFKEEKDITISSVAYLSYLNASLEETLRIYPPAPNAFERRIPKGGDIVCGQYVPEDTIVGVSNYCMNHNPNNFRDPEAFVPERWLGDSQYKTDQKHAMQAFSYGPRNCIGKNLALAEMKLASAKMLWNFDLEATEDIEGWAEKQKSYVVWQKDPLMVNMKPRKMANGTA